MFTTNRLAPNTIATKAARKCGVVTATCRRNPRAARTPCKTPASLRVTKALLKSAQAAEIQARMGEEAVQFAQMLVAPEAREAMTAFMEKRKPDFSQFD